jgi:hypothetical protein
LGNPPLKPPGIQKQVVDVRLLKFPELGRGMLADGVNETVSVKHGLTFLKGLTVA